MPPKLCFGVQYSFAVPVDVQNISSPRIAIDAGSTSPLMNVWCIAPVKYEETRITITERFKMNN